MKVKETMTRDVRIVKPGDTLQKAAALMAECDIGVLPVGDGDRLVGMITDRDIAVRGIANGLGADAKVGDVMSEEVLYCFQDEDLGEVADNMGEIKVRRLPVLDRDKRLVGIVSIGDIALRNGDAEIVGEAITVISAPGGLHSQMMDGR